MAKEIFIYCILYYLILFEAKAADGTNIEHLSDKYHRNLVRLRQLPTLKLKSVKTRA